MGKILKVEQMVATVLYSVDLLSVAHVGSLKAHGPM